MAFSVSPSVIVREVDASAAVPAIATPPAAIAGDFKWGPTNEAILISSENDLVNRFGKPDDTNYETFFAAADYLSYANALYVSRASKGGEMANSAVFVPDPGGNTALDVTHEGAWKALYEGTTGNSILVSWCNNTDFETALLAVGDIPADRITDSEESQDLTFLSKTQYFEVSPEDRIEDVSVGDILRIGNPAQGYQDLEVATWSETTILNQSNNQIVDTYTYDVVFTENYLLGETALETLSITKKWKYYDSFQKAPDAGDEHIHVVVIDTTGDISGSAGYVLEKYENLSLSSGATLADGRTNYYETVISNGSAWIQTANTTYLGVTDSGYETLAGGTDGGTVPTLGQISLAWDVFKNANEIDISFCLTGKNDDAGVIANYVISNIAESRKDVVAFISPSKEAVVDELINGEKLNKVIAYRNKLQNSSYWFMDSGYKYRYDKYNDVYRWVPMNGDMAGLAARVEPYESPAGFRKGVIKNIVKLAFNPNKTQRDLLYSSDINPVMSQVGQGIVLFGDKTGLGLPSSFDRINVRRLFIAVEKAIANAAQSFLFELNDEFTQTQFKNIVDPFLREIQGRRGITDFRVVSDGTVNTAEVIDANQFRANIYIKPARSINVIELTFVATRTGIEFDEIVGSLS
jgi:hypothetical protein